MKILVGEVEFMPLVRIEMLKGKSREYKKAVLAGIHQALVNAFKIPEVDRLQRIYELDAEDFELPPWKSKDFILIEMTVFKGRSPEAKKKLITGIAENLEKSVGLKKEDIMIVIHEPEMENWGIRGLPGTELNFGFKIDV